MAVVLVEYLLLDRAGERERDPTILRSLVGQPETLPEILDEPVLTAGAPSWGKDQGIIIPSGYARVTVIAGGVQCAWGGVRPDPTQGLQLVAGDPPAFLELKPGDKIAFVRIGSGRASGGARADLQLQGNASLAQLAAAIGGPDGIRVRPPSAAPASAAPVTGRFVADGQSTAFNAEAGRPINVQLSSDEAWSATIRLLRRLPGDAAFRPLTLVGQPWAVFSGPVNEPVWEESEVGAQFLLECAHASGQIDYRISQ